MELGDKRFIQCASVEGHRDVVVELCQLVQGSGTTGLANITLAQIELRKQQKLLLRCCGCALLFVHKAIYEIYDLKSVIPARRDQ